MISRLIHASILVSSLAFLAGCGTEQNASEGPKAESSVRIAARDDFFDPKVVSVEADKPVEVTFVNRGSNPHEVEIKGLVPETMIQPGESRSFTVTPKRRTYRMYCEIHEDDGMEGRFVGR